MKAKVIKAYAIELKADEAMDKTGELKELMDKTGSLGVHPMYPFAYALYRTRNKKRKNRINGCWYKLRFEMRKVRILGRK